MPNGNPKSPRTRDSNTERNRKRDKMYTEQPKSARLASSTRKYEMVYHPSSSFALYGITMACAFLANALAWNKYTVLVAAFALNTVGAHGRAWARWHATCLAAEDAASLQMYTKLGLIVGLATASVLSAKWFSAICALVSWFGCSANVGIDKGQYSQQACYWRVAFCMGLTGLALTATGKMLSLELVHEHGMSTTLAKTWTMVILQVPFAVPMHKYLDLYGFRLPKPTGIKSKHKVAWNWALVLLLLASVTSDELADTAKRQTINEHSGQIVYLLGGATSLCISMLGEFVGSFDAFSMTHVAATHVTVQIVRTNAMMDGINTGLAYTTIVLEDFIGGISTGTLNAIQERDLRARGKHSLWIDWFETITKGVMPSLCECMRSVLGYQVLSDVGIAMNMQVVIMTMWLAFKEIN